MKKYLFIIATLILTLSAPLAYGATLPEKRADMMNTTKNSIETFRIQTFADIKSEQSKTQKEIKQLESSGKSTNNAKLLDATQKPIDYIKLFFLAIFAFIFATSVVFYVATALLAFLILRFIYRKIRNR